jgi:hypothetical protein
MEHTPRTAKARRPQREFAVAIRNRPGQGLREMAV